ncbi:MAG: glycosyltransferase [Candidatus Saccharimonadales bacterium]
MTSFILQLLSLLKTGHVQIFLVFFLFVQIFWWLRVYIASKNKRYTDEFKGTFAVIVAVLREDPVIFEKSLKSISQYGKPSEFIVSIDDYTHADAEIKRIAKKYATHVIEQPELLGKREQYALCTEAMKKNVDVIVTVDSDTIWDDTTVNILKPFNNPKVGAVSGRQTIFNSNDNFIRRIADWFEDLRFRVTLPFQSYYGQVNVIPGRTLAARAGIYKEVAQKVRNETYLGRKIITSDDASVTMEILKAGYLSVYQDDSHVSTDAPNTVKGFVNQYLRWYRGAFRRFVTRFSQLIRMNPLVFLSNVEFLFLTFIYAGIILIFIFKLVFNVYDFGNVEGFALTESFNVWFVLLLVLGYFISSYIRNLPHLIHNKKDILFLPVFAIFTFVVMAFLKVVASFSMFENGWMTRSSKNRHQEKGLLPTRAYAVLVSIIVLVLTVPLAYFVDIAPTNVPFSTIVANQGPAFYRAQQVVLSYQNDKTQDQDLHMIEAAYERHGGKDNDTSVAAKCVQDKLTSQPQASKAEEPFEVFDNCRTIALQEVNTVAQKVTKTVAETAKPTTSTQVEATAPLSLSVSDGDSQSTLSRSLIASDNRSTNLSASQKAYLENRLVAVLGNNDLVYAGQVFKVDQSQFASLVEQSKNLSESDLRAWSQYQ